MAAALSNISLTIILILGISLVHTSEAFINLIDHELEYLIPHNIARAAQLLPPLVWNDTLAQYAEAYAHERAGDCALQHSNYLIPGYGENIATNDEEYLSPAQAVDLWVGEKPFYDYGSNSCTGGQMCGHYTQVIWKTTQSVGCASARCQSGGTFVTCNYYPPGNYIGDRPY